MDSGAGGAAPGAAHAERWLVGVLGCVVVLVVAGDVYVGQRVERIERDAAQIAVYTAPTIAALAAARADVSEIRSQAEREMAGLAAGQSASDSGALRRARAALDEDVSRYLRTPAQPAERAMWREVATDLAEIDAALATTGAALEAHDGGAARARLSSLRTPARRAATAMLQVIALNAGSAREAAVRISAARRSVEASLRALDLLVGAVAMLAAAVAVAAIRRARAGEQAAYHALRDRASELELFGARVAHDIRSPLMVVRLSLDTVARAPDATVAATATARAHRSLASVLRVVDDLLAFARSGARPARGAHAAVAAVLADLGAELLPEAAAAGVELAIAPYPPSREVACARGVLTCVLSNLMRNAVKHLGASPERRVEVRVAASGPCVRFEVEDTGPGVPDTERERIFEPYVRLSEAAPGLGLGLATVKRLCEAHGGRVGVEGARGGGSVFWCELPAWAPPPVVHAELDEPSISV